MSNRKFRATKNRAGNIIRHNGLVSKVVKAGVIPLLIDWKGNEFRATDKFSCKGILLTHKILSLVGFTENQLPIEIKCSGFTVAEEQDGSFTIVAICDFNEKVTLKMKAKFITGPWMTINLVDENNQTYSFSPPLETVHQLQNAHYSFTGKELDVESVYSSLKPNFYKNRS